MELDDCYSLARWTSLTFIALLFMLMLAAAAAAAAAVHACRCC